MWRAPLARIGDALTFAFLALAFVVDLTGGIRFGRDWYRVTATDATHLVYVAIGVALSRHLLVRHPSLRERLTERRTRRAARTGIAPSWQAPTPREWLIAACVLAIATGWVLQDQIWMITGVPDRGDPWFSMWRLAWVAHQVRVDPWHLFDANIFAPATNTLAYSDATLLPGLIVTPLVWMGVPVAVAHGLLYVASFFAAGLAMFPLARAATGQVGAGLLSSVLFAFYPYRISTYSHLEMQGVLFMPLACWCLLRLLDAGRRRDAMWLGVAVAAEALWSLYLGAFLIVGLATLVGIRWAAGHFTWRSRAVALGVAAAVLVVALTPYSLPYWRARAVVGDRGPQEVRTYSARPGDYLIVNDMNRVWGRRLRADVMSERHLFPGASSLVLAAIALVPPAAPLATSLVAASLVAVDASLGPEGVVFPPLYDHAPGFRAFRVPARFGFVVGLFLTLTAGLGLARLTRRGGAWTHGVSAVAIGFALFESRPALELTATPTTPPEIYATLAAGPTDILAELPFPADEKEYWVDPTYLYYSTFHWRRLLNGYSGFVPDWYSRLTVASRELPSDDAVEVLRGAGAEWIVIHESAYPAGRYREIVAGLEGSRVVTQVDVKVDRDGEHRVYRVKPR